MSTNFLNMIRVGNIMKPMKNSYIYQNDMIYEFMNGEIVRILHKMYITQALYPIILKENGKVYKRLDYF